jgi:hypothetical protein
LLPTYRHDMQLTSYIMPSESRVGVHTRFANQLIKFNKKAVAQGATALFVFVLFCITLNSCQKGKGPCFDNNTGILVVKNTSPYTAHIWIDGSDKGYFAPGTNYSGAALTGSHVVDTGGDWPTKTVTVEQCLTYTLTLQ